MKNTDVVAEFVTLEAGSGGADALGESGYWFVGHATAPDSGRAAAREHRKQLRRRFVGEAARWRGAIRLVSC